MARATTAKSSDAPRDAVALLKQDHRLVEQLFDQFEEAEEDSEKSQLATRACQLLTVHAQIEEEILYPAAKQALSEDEEEAELVPEAQVEHTSAKDLIAKIEGMTPDDELFEATVKVLGEYVKHHVKEEENEMFPALKKADLDLKELGAQLSERKYALMEQMGIDMEEAEESSATTRKRSSGGSRAKSSSRGRQARAGARSKSKSSSGRNARH